MSIDKTDHASRRSGMIFIGFLLLLISYAFVLTVVTQGQRVNTFDLVLIGGRVMDPESGLDAVRNIGVSGGRVSAISAGRLHRPPFARPDRRELSLQGGGRRDDRARDGGRCLAGRRMVSRA
jgi:hypothetical protein